MGDPLQDVRRVFAAELGGTLRGQALIDQCTLVAVSLQRQLRSAPSGHDFEVDEEIWHYLSDADIRSRDREYGKIQLETIAKLLDGR